MCPQNNPSTLWKDLQPPKRLPTQWSNHQAIDFLWHHITSISCLRPFSNNADPILSHSWFLTPKVQLFLFNLIFHYISSAKEIHKAYTSPLETSQILKTKTFSSNPQSTNIGRKILSSKLHLNWSNHILLLSMVRKLRFYLITIEFLVLKNYAYFFTSIDTMVFIFPN